MSAKVNSTISLWWTEAYNGHLNYTSKIIFWISFLKIVDLFVNFRDGC